MEFKLNADMPWTMWNSDNENPPLDTPIWMLCEEDTCNPTQYPAIFRVIIHEVEDKSGMSLRSIEKGTRWKFRLLDFDPDKEDEYLSPNMWTFIAWREMTDHGGTWDKFMEDDNRQLHQNWMIE